MPRDSSVTQSFVLAALAVVFVQQAVAGDPFAAAGFAAVAAWTLWRGWRGGAGVRALAGTLLLVAAAAWLALPRAGVEAAAAPERGEPVPVEWFLRGANATAGQVRLAGRVVDAAPTFGRGVRLTVEVETIGADGHPPRASSGRVSVSLRETSRRWRHGDRLSLRSRLRRIVGFGNFGEFDWAAYNARRGRRLTAYAWNDRDVEILEASDGVVDGLRRRLSLAAAATGGQGAEILAALTIGDRTGLARETQQAVRDAGLAHFLAISGAHMGLVLLLAVALVRATAGRSLYLLQRYDILRGAAVAGALAVLGYGAVSGGGVSVARSLMMALAAMAALWRGRPGDGLRALAASAVVLSLAMPGVGEEAGFQLSFTAVTALLLEARRQAAATRAAASAKRACEPGAEAKSLDGRAGGAAAVDLDGQVSGGAAAKSVDGRGSGAAATGEPTSGLIPEAGLFGLGGPVDEGASRWRRVLQAIRTAGRITLICWAVTTPLVAYHFQRISLVAPLANLLAAPLVSGVVVCGLGGLATLPVWPAAGETLIWIGALLAEAVLAIAFAFASLPLAAATTPNPGPLLTAALSGAVLVVLLPAWRWKRLGLALLLAGAALLVAAALHGRLRDDVLDVWFTSVGQGDAVVLRLPGGRVMVVDAGPPGRGRLVVTPLLRRAWVGRVDVLVATHLHDDHHGGLGELLEEFEVGELWLPDGPCETSGARRLIETAEARGVPVRFVSIGRDAPLARGRIPAKPSYGIEMLWPPAGAASCDSNDQSIVLRVSFAGRRLLLTGDIEAAAEGRLLREPERLGADVLKVPHHGSRTSSGEDFLRAVSPSLAVASLGLDNRFNFPAQEVQQRYAELGIELLRTDLRGAVHLRIHGDGRIAVRTVRPAESRDIERRDPGAPPRRQAPESRDIERRDPSAPPRRQAVRPGGADRSAWRRGAQRPTGVCPRANMEGTGGALRRVPPGRWRAVPGGTHSKPMTIGFEGPALSLPPVRSR